MKQYVAGEDMIYSWNIFKELPDANFFKVGIAGKDKVFVTLDNSVGFYGIQPFCPNHNMEYIDFIDILRKDCDVDREFVHRVFIGRDVCFPETGMRYKFSVREDLKKDYLITKIARITAR